jgi:hypothetical protein
MHRVVISNIGPTEVWQLKDQLIRDGLIMHEDFEWAYHPSQWDGFTKEHPNHTVFSFRDPALATFYQLKWA